LEATPKPAPNIPRVYLVTDKHDFGTVRRGDVVTASFVIRNTHPVAVECGPVMKGCSCASAEVEPKVIPAGGEGKLTVAWNLAGKRGSSVETVIVPFAGEGGVKASVVAVVRGAVEVDRELIDLDETNRTAEVVIHSPVGRAFRCVRAVANHPCVTASVGPAGDRVRFTFDPAVRGWEYGNIYVTVLTDQPEEQEVRIAVRVNKDHPTH
jgi:hypothetical protein